MGGRTKKEKSGKTALKKIGMLFTTIGSIVSAVLLTYLQHQEKLKVLYNEWFREPNISYKMEEGYEIIENSFELKDGLLVLHPQLVVQLGKNVIRRISLDDLYETNNINYESGIVGFKTKTGRWEYANELANVIYKELEARLSVEELEKIEMKKIILLELRYHNQESDVLNTEYYKIENGMVDLLVEKEMETYGIEYEINIQNALDWRGNVDIKIIVEDCLNGIGHYS